MSRHPSEEELAAYWAEDLDASDEAEIEEHVFDCPSCAALWERFAGLTHALGQAIPPVVTAAQLERLQRAGLRTRIDPVPAGAFRGQFSADLDLLVFALAAPLEGVARVDLEVAEEDGSGAYLVESVPFDPGAGRVLLACQRHYRDHHAGPTIRFRLVGVDQSGRTELGTYSIEHVFEDT